MKYTSSKVLKLLAQKCLQRDQKHDILNQDLNWNSMKKKDT